MEIAMDHIENLFQKHGGIMQTKALTNNGIGYRKIQQLLKGGVIEQLRRGYYQYIDEKSFSDLSAITTLFPDGVLCLESALDHYGYTDRTPSAWHIAVDVKTGRTRFKINYPIVKPHFIDSKKFQIGITESEADGFCIRVYDRERTICDCLLHKNKMESEVFNNAIKAYIDDPEKNKARLGEYAGQLRVEKKMREVIGIWL